MAVVELGRKVSSCCFACTAVTSPSILPSCCTARTLLTVHRLFIGNQAAISSPFVLSLPTLVSPPQLLSCPTTPFFQPYILPSSPSVPYPMILLGLPGVPHYRAALLASSVLPRGVPGLCANPPREHKKAVQGHIPHVCHQPVNDKSRSLFSDDTGGLRCLPQPLSGRIPPRSGGKNQTPSGQFGILQWCIFADGQIYFGEENACGEPRFTQVL